MIYIIVDLPCFQKELSQNRVHMLNFFGTKEDITILTPQNFNSEIIKKDDIILFFFIRVFRHSSVHTILPFLPIIKKIGSVIYTYIEDFMYIEETHYFLKTHRLENIIFSMKHSAFEKKYLKKNPNYKISVLHHFFDLNMFPPFIEKKKYDILIYGNCNKRIYPIRYFLKKLFQRKKYRFKIIESNHYKLESDSIIGKELYKEINNSYITLATTGKYKFFTKKYQEIPLSGSMIFGTIPENYKDIYNSENIIVLSNLNDETIIKTIDEHLEKKDLLLEKIKNFQKVIRKKFCMENAYLELKKIIE